MFQELKILHFCFIKSKHSSIYGVEIPGTEGRAGMVSIISSKSCEDFDSKGFLSVLQNNLPQYAIPKYVRFLCELSTTSTFKIRKSVMKQEGFDIKKIDDPIYILLPNSEEYIPLSEEIYEKIKKEVYRF